MSITLFRREFIASIVGESFLHQFAYKLKFAFWKHAELYSTFLSGLKTKLLHSLPTATHVVMPQNVSNSLASCRNYSCGLELTMIAGDYLQLQYNES